MSVQILFVPNEGAIMGLTLTSRGMVSRWLRWLTYEMETAAVAFTPVRTGRMKTSWSAGTDVNAPTFTRTRLSNSAPYAVYVMEGTTGHGRYIYPKVKRALAVGKSQGGPIFLRRRVKTQDANNVAMNALRVVFARHGM